MQIAAGDTRRVSLAALAGNGFPGLGTAATVGLEVQRVALGAGDAGVMAVPFDFG